jgi:acyl-CoA synthetase (NDP forming)
LPLSNAAGVINEYDAKRFLDEAGIPAIPQILLSEQDLAALTVLPFAAPLVLKISSPDIHHKTEVGGVVLGIDNLEQLKAAAATMIATVRAAVPGARIDGLLVQRQFKGTEVIIGVRNDRYFGPLVMVGLGGVFVELIRDVSYRFAPFDRSVAEAMLGELKTYPLLTGYRGQPRADIGALSDILVRVAALAYDYRDRIAEIDINPILVAHEGEGAFVADALIVRSDKHHVEG